MASEVGRLSEASVAGPPSPALRGRPSPTTVEMIPSWSTTRMTWFLLSAM
jgi:hypothetical protein